MAEKIELSRRVTKIKPSQTLEITAMAKEMRADGFQVIGFAAGEPDFDTPRNIKDAACRAISMGLTKYTPAAGTRELREAVARDLKRKHDLEYEWDQIVVSNGAKHSLFNTFQTILNPGDEVIVLRPYWLSYPELIQLAGGVPVYVDLLQENNFEPRPEDIEKAFTDRTKAIIVNNPSNPCGATYKNRTLREIARLAEKQDIIIVSDEIYGDLVYDGRKHDSIAHFSHDVYDRTIVINGLSKSYAMTGWRIGYSASIKPIARLMTSLQSHTASNPGSVSQYAALEALTGPQDDLYRMRDEFDARRKRMVELTREIPGLSCAVPEGAFYVMVNVSQLYGKSYDEREVTDSSSFCKMLLEKAMVAAVPGSAFGADDYIRLSYATGMEDIEVGMARLRRFVSVLMTEPQA